jgi:hypothetical protein
MPNFIVPVVGNPNGGFQNGDQVTAENLNAHVTNAVPTGEFISGRGESLAVSGLDYFLKLGEDGNLYKVASGLIGGSAELLRPDFIRSGTGDGVNSMWGSLVVENYNHFYLSIGAYTDASNPNGGTFDSTANSYLFKFKNSYVFQTRNNIFQVGTSDYRGWIRNYASVWNVDSTSVPEFTGTHALRIPVGSTAQRPGTGSNPNATVGSVRFNSDTNDLEFMGINSEWGSVKGSGEVTYVKQIPSFTFAWDSVFYETPSVVVPEGEVWIYELNYQFNADNWGGNTRPECIFSTAIFFNTVQKVVMNHFTGPYGGPISSATATVTLRREDTFVNGTAFPVKIVWKNIPGGSRRFGSYSDGAYAYGYIKLTKVKTAAQGSTTLL